MAKALNKKKLNVLTVFLLYSILVFSDEAFSLTSKDSVQNTDPSFQKGMCFNTLEKDGMDSPLSVEALKYLRNNIGANYVQINVTQYQDRFNSTSIRRTEMTIQDASIRKIIKDAHKLGLSVMLKPHVDIIDNEDGTYLRGDIGFADEKSWEEWFSSYRKFILGYAKIAERCSAESLCIGTGLTFTVSRTDKWLALIEEIRRVYKGNITYAANWDDFENVEFWDKLDFVGINAYFPLAGKLNAGKEEIKAGWELWRDKIEKWHKKVNKQIVFTEIGYASSAHAACEPWRGGSGIADTDIQARCFSSFFEVIWGSSWFSGAYIWRWAPTVYGGGANNKEYTILNKPSETIVKKFYAEVNPPGRASDDRRQTTDDKYLVMGPVMEDISDGSFTGVEQIFNVPGRTAGAVMHLSPAYKTQDEPEFREEWLEKSEEIMKGEQ